jgi:hypothetical protein
MARQLARLQVCTGVRQAATATGQRPPEGGRGSGCRPQQNQPEYQQVRAMASFNKTSLHLACRLGPKKPYPD